MKSGMRWRPSTPCSSRSVVPFFLCVTDLLIALPMHADENGDILI